VLSIASAFCAPYCGAKFLALADFSIESMDTSSQLKNKRGQDSFLFMWEG
jgi:hypothetical protein